MMAPGSTMEEGWTWEEESITKRGKIYCSIKKDNRRARSLAIQRLLQHSTHGTVTAQNLQEMNIQK
jgi:hypothetical protein